MKYIILFSFMLALAAAAFSFMQYQKIAGMEEKIDNLDKKLPRFAEAATELESRIQRLEMENAYLKSGQQGQYKMPEKQPVQQVPTQPVQQPTIQGQPTFKDMQKK